MQAQMLAPAAVLVVWTLIVLFWVVPTRFGAIAKVEDKSTLPRKVGARGADLEAVLPDKANWPSHNHSHLHEQPTLFYAISIILAMMGPTGFDVLLAWLYVGLRIIHSLWQILVNKVSIRIVFFFLSTIVLLLLAVRAVLATALADPSVLQ
jgi:hypothetical protein